jgi:hypothetical protein
MKPVMERAQLRTSQSHNVWKLKMAIIQEGLTTLGVQYGGEHLRTGL